MSHWLDDYYEWGNRLMTLVQESGIWTHGREYLEMGEALYAKKRGWA